MTLREVLRVLGLYVVLLVGACIVVHRTARLAPISNETIVSAWEHGKLVGRVLEKSPNDSDALAKTARTKGYTLVRESVVGESPIVTRLPLAFALSFVPGKDGVKATLGGDTVYVTPDDLLAAQVYDRRTDLGGLGIGMGVDEEFILAKLAEHLRTSVSEVREFATIHRIRVVKTVADDAPKPRSPAELTPATLRESAVGAARYLARGMRDDGRFRYFVDAPTNRDLPGYDWARHAGGAYFLVQAAAVSHEPELSLAAKRAIAIEASTALTTCGAHRCIATDNDANVSDSALFLLALTEQARIGATDVSAVRDVAAFLRSLQRPDGELMHFYDRAAKRPVDLQILYASGEAGLALARAHRITNDAADLDAASRILAHLVGPAWRFFGNRYYFGEEHWTCQLAAELWDRAPNRAALDFCLRWHAYGRAMQYTDGETAFDSAGAFGVGNVVTPRITPAASRCEAAAATLAMAHRAGVDAAELSALEAGLRGALAFVARHQLGASSAYLLADADAVRGAFPGSAVDLRLRTDYAQHAGSAMLSAADAVSR